MLSASDVHLTPRRPKPPAKLRRASKEKSRTPPVPALQLNLDSDNPPPPYDEQDDLQEKLKERLLPALEEWMHDRSREELSDLLLAAGGMIKERETELGLTSKLCKNLYQENVSLKTKHEALLARIPIQTQASTSAPSPLPSPTRSLSPLPPGSPHYYSVSRPTSPTMSPFSSTSSPAIRRAGHARRISVTPSELTVLADQNAELMHKLERLEEESTQADLQGKKKLRKLEKEIALLREELERTRERGNELEEKVLGVVQKVGEDESESERKRREREERVRALRGTKRAEKEAEQVVDFAPAPELSRSSKAVPPPIKLAPSSPLPEDGTTLVTPSATSSAAITPSTSETFTLPENLPPQSLEHSIINQLLSKIRELEVTNQQISDEQQATAERLQAAQKDVDNIRRAYDCLDESEELCVVQEDGDFDIFADPMSPVSPPKRIPTGQTIRFSSLRRNLEGDITSLAGTDDPSDFFDSGVVRQSTTRGGLDVLGDELVEDGQKPRQAPKARKTVVGLFTSPSIAPPVQGDLSPISMPGSLADVSGWSTTANDSLTVPGPSTSPTDSHRSGSVSPSVYASPMPGGLDFPMSPEPAQVSFPSISMHSHTQSQSSYMASPSLSALDVPNASRPLHSLGSELGSEYEYGFGNRALSEMGDIDEDREDVGSVADSGIAEDDTFSEGPSNMWDLRRRVISGTTVVGSSRSVASDDDYVASTPTKQPRRVFPRDPYMSDDGSLRAPRVVVQPPTPSPNRIMNKGKSKGGLEAEKLDKYNRNTRLSMTVRARTSRWVERRYNEHGSGSIDIPQTIPDAGPVPFPSSSSVIVFPTSTATPEAHQQPKRRRSLMSLQTGMGIHRAVKNVAASEIRRVSSGGAYVRERKRTMDETFEEAVHRVSRSISFSGGQDGFDFEANVISRRAARGGSDGDRTPSRMQRFTFPPPKPRMSTSEPIKPQAQAKPAQKEEVTQHKGFVGFVLEIWLWLQFAVVIMVFLWAMARRGPKSVLEDAERTVARRRT